MTAPGSPDPVWTNRILALLAKAESTEFPEESEALMAKVQELMSRHAIDHALLDRERHAAPDRVVTEFVEVAAPYASAKSSLLGRVADANDCQVVIQKLAGGNQRCAIVGHESDLANVHLLFSSLCLHAVRAMLAAEVPDWEAPRRFRHAFLLSFSYRIGERLHAARETARADAGREATDGGTAMGLVLADRSDEVDAAVAEAFPNIRYTRVTSSSTAGHLSGRAAADRAGLNRSAPSGQVPGLRAG